MSELYERIKEIAEKYGYSVNQLRIKANLSPGVLGDLKSGKSKNLSRATAEKLADALGITVDELYGVQTEEKEITTSQLKFALFNGDKEITDDMLNEVLRFAEFVKQRENDKQNP